MKRTLTLLCALILGVQLLSAQETREQASASLAILTPTDLENKELEKAKKKTEKEKKNYEKRQSKIQATQKSVTKYQE